MSREEVLPVLLSIPHGGLEVPSELKDLCQLTLAEILADGDTWSREIYSWPQGVVKCIEADVARAVVDMNRSPQELPPDNPDGVVKTVTVSQKKIWPSDQGLPQELVGRLVADYHTPYHEAIGRAMADSMESKGKNNIKIELGLDCHTMLELAPPGAETPGVLRPLICLSNGGDEQGLTLPGQHLTASTQLLLTMRDALKQAFFHQDVQVEINLESAPPVLLNQPFKGGYISRHHSNRGIPWLQLELNRSLYLPVHGQLAIAPDYETQRRLTDLRHRFRRSLQLLW